MKFFLLVLYCNRTGTRKTKGPDHNRTRAISEEALKPKTLAVKCYLCLVFLFLLDIFIVSANGYFLTNYICKYIQTN